MPDLRRFDLFPAVLIKPDETRVENVRLYTFRGRLVVVTEDSNVVLRADVESIRRSQANRRRWEVEATDGTVYRAQKIQAKGCGCKQPLGKITQRRLQALVAAGEEVSASG